MEKNNDGNKKKYFFIKSNEEDGGQFTKKVEQQQNIFVWRWNKQQQMFSVRLTVPRYYYKSTFGCSIIYLNELKLKI